MVLEPRVTPDHPLNVFYPESIPAEWDAVEMHPCQILDDGTGTWVEQCYPEDGDPVHMWSVYLHDVEGGIRCIADFETQEMAQGFTTFLETLFTKRVVNLLTRYA